MQYDTCEKRADDVLVLPLAEQKTVLSIGSLSYRDNPALVVLLGGADDFRSGDTARIIRIASNAILGHYPMSSR